MKLLLLLFVSCALVVSANDFPDCFATKVADSGEIVYPTKTKKYPHNADVCWRIIPKNIESRGPLKINFAKVDVEEKYDKISVFNWGTSKWDSKEVKGRGEFSSTEGFFIRFKSDHSVHATGFRVSWHLAKAESNSEDNGGSTDENTVSFDLNVDANHRQSKTERYASDGDLVIRRGKTFDITVKNAEVDQFLLTLRLDSSEEKPIIVKESNRNSPYGWSVKRAGSKYTFTTTKDTPVGIYDIDCVLKGGDVVGDDARVFVIFNALSAEDDASCPANDRRHMLIPDTGYAYYGSSNRWGKMRWGFDQYLLSNLEVSMEFLDGLDIDDRSRVAPTTRYISWRGNNRFLHGRWDGEYGDGKEPGFWKDTTTIFAKYRETNRRVKYGQCWVFAAMSTTVHRALGLCSRPITNFDSAHESPDEDKTPSFEGRVDNYYDEKPDGIYRNSDKSPDSVWNFHVWNEVQMKRPDMEGVSEDMRDGWNAVDTTCQEMSGGRCQCGPGPIAIMKKGKQWFGEQAIRRRHDVDFISSETDALVYGWIKRKGSSTYKPWRIQTRKTGALSLAWNGVRDEDRSTAYKVPRYRSVIYVRDGSSSFPDLEKYRVGSGSFLELKALERLHNEQHLEGKLKLPSNIKEAKVTDELKFGVELTGKKVAKGLKINLMVEAISYNGVHVFDVVHKDTCTIDSKVGKIGEGCLLTLKEEHIAKSLKNTFNFRVTASTGGAGDSTLDWVDTYTFSYVRPKVEFPDVGTMEAGTIKKVSVKFTNPLTKTELTGCVLTAAVSGERADAAVDVKVEAMMKKLEQQQQQQQGQGPTDQVQQVSQDSLSQENVAFESKSTAYTVRPSGNLDMFINTKASNPGKHSLLASLTCSNMLTLHGEAEFTVSPGTQTEQSSLTLQQMKEAFQKAKQELADLKKKGELTEPEPDQLDQSVLVAQQAQRQKETQPEIREQEQEPGQQKQTQQLPKDLQDKEQVQQQQQQRQQRQQQSSQSSQSSLSGGLSSRLKKTKVAQDAASLRRDSQKILDEVLQKVKKIE